MLYDISPLAVQHPAQHPTWAMILLLLNPFYSVLHTAPISQAIKSNAVQHRPFFSTAPAQQNTEA